jgi:phosphoribosylanthranilate isomerase
LHGDEPPSLCDKLGRQAIKAVRVKDENSLAGLERFSVAAFLLDSYCRDKRGGTGQTFRWEIAAKAKEFGKPVILSGGLSPANVAVAVNTAGPYAVDVSSGVEAEPGKKDHRLLKAFITAARGRG